jgi:hypothetical protein
MATNEHNTLAVKCIIESPFSAAMGSLRTSIRYRGLSGRNGSTMMHSKAGAAFNSSKNGHPDSEPTKTICKQPHAEFAKSLGHYMHKSIALHSSSNT